MYGPSPAQAVAFLAHEHRRKVMIEERGAIDELARVAVECCKAPDGKGFRPWGVTGENTRSKQDTELLETAVTALLNLSTISKNQARGSHPRPQAATLCCQTKGI